MDEDWAPLAHASPMVDRLRSVVKKEGTYDSLDCLLYCNSDKDARLGDKVARLDLGRLMDPVGMQPSPVLAPDVEGVEEEREDPVSCYGCCEGEVLVR